MNDKLSVLVVDDIEGMRRILANSLSQIGVSQVHTAVNGAEAWRILQTVPVDAIITDWNMPAMSGLELLKAIRASSSLSRLPVLMMTAETERHQVQVAIEAGVSEYMVKPFNVAALQTKLRKALEMPRPRALQDTKEVPVLRQAGVSRSLASQRSDDSAGDADANPARAVILAVDDVPGNLDVLVKLLGSDYQVRVANSGERALKILEGGKLPDLILLDVMMPEMDGFEVCRRIKANPAWADIPVIFLTALGDATDVEQGFAAGAVDFVTKPADPPILRARIATHLRLLRSFAELKRNRVVLLEQNAMLQDHLRLREEVERMAQHDIRSPLAGIAGFAAGLLDDDQLAEDHKVLVRDIEQAAYTALNLVNLSLDLLKMEQGSYTLQPVPVDIAAVLARLVHERQSEMRVREVSVQWQYRGQQVPEWPHLLVLGDELLCYSLFSNLLKNALEAASSGTALILEVREVDDRLELELTNDGVVPVDIREGFFDKFSTAGKVGGTGIGTYSARLMAQTQLGDITMRTSDADHTTSLTVTLLQALDLGQAD